MARARRDALDPGHRRGRQRARLDVLEAQAVLALPGRTTGAVRVYVQERNRTSRFEIRGARSVLGRQEPRGEKRARSARGSISAVPWISDARCAGTRRLIVVRARGSRVTFRVVAGQLAVPVPCETARSTERARRVQRERASGPSPRCHDAHGFDADPRLWGFLDTRAPASSTPTRSRRRAEHQMEWDVLSSPAACSGCACGTRTTSSSPPRTLFCRPVDPPAEADAFDGDEGVSDRLGRRLVARAAIAIDDARHHQAKSLTAVYMIGLPVRRSSSWRTTRSRCTSAPRREGAKRAMGSTRRTRRRRGRARRGRLLARDPCFNGDPPARSLVVEKAKPFEDPYAVAERDHRDDASVVVVDVNGRR